MIITDRCGTIVYLLQGMPRPDNKINIVSHHFYLLKIILTNKTITNED